MITDKVSFVFLFVSVIYFFRVGINIPTIEVRYEHLNVEAETYVGSRALPTFVNFVTNMVEVYLADSSSDFCVCFFELISLSYNFFLSAVLECLYFSAYSLRQKETCYYP